MESENQIRSEKGRNLLEIPPDVQCRILSKLSPVDVFFGAQLVCSSWRNLSKEPEVWESIDMRDLCDSMEGRVDLLAVADHAVDRSDGKLIEFSIGDFGRDDNLGYMAGRSPLLKCLRLASCIYVTNDGMIEAVKKLPKLEELDLSDCQFSTKVIEAIGQHCPLLKSFKLSCPKRNGSGKEAFAIAGNMPGLRYLQLDLSYCQFSTKVIEAIGQHCPLLKSFKLSCPKRSNDASGEAAFAIAGNMPGLRYLQLFCNKLTNDGLKAILDGCPNLESLDLHKCPIVADFEEDLLRRCSDSIKFLKLPKVCVKENEFGAGTDSYELFDWELSYNFYGGGTDVEMLESLEDFDSP